MDDILAVRKERALSAILSAIFGLALLVFHPAVFAIVVEIEPDDFAIGTSLARVSTFVEITGFNGGDVFAEPSRSSAGDPTGQLTFGSHGYSGELSSVPFDSSCPSGSGLSAAENGVCHWGLGLYFSQPVEWVSLLALNSTYSSPLPAWWSAHDSSGATVAWGQSDGGLEDNRRIPFEVRLQAENFSFILIGGATGIPMEFDRLRFKVPEPSTAHLIISGFFFMLVFTLTRLSVKRRLR